MQCGNHFFLLLQIIEHLDCLFCLIHADFYALGGEIIADLVGNGKNSSIAGPDNQDLGLEIDDIGKLSNLGAVFLFPDPRCLNAVWVYDHIARIVFPLNSDTAEGEGLYFQRIPLKSFNELIPRKAARINTFIGIGRQELSHLRKDVCVEDQD
jgi:hypothetical protein